MATHGAVLCIARCRPALGRSAASPRNARRRPSLATAVCRGLVPALVPAAARQEPYTLPADGDPVG